MPALDNLQAVYLNKETPTSIIIDESKNGNNANLVQSNCSKFDGNTEAIGNGDNLLDSNTVFNGAVKFKTGDDETTRVLIAKRDSSVLCFMLYLTSTNDLNILISDDGTDTAGHYETFTFATVSRNEWHELTFSFNNGHWIYNIDGTDYTGDNTTVTSMFVDNVTKTAIGNYDGGSYNYIGNISYVKFGNAEFNLAEGGLSDTLYNTGTVGGDAVLSGATLTDFWSEKQDIYHYNFLNGFDLWENGNAGEEIRVPIDKTVTTSGYTYTATYQAGKWHNNAETRIQIPNTLIDIQDSTPISSITNNKRLRWVDGELREYVITATGNSSITEYGRGTRMYSPDGDYVIARTTFKCIEANKTYKYYVEIDEVNAGSIVIIASDDDVVLSSTGVHTGILNPTADGYAFFKRYGGATDIVIVSIYIWEDGTIPPLSYEEMESDFNNVHTVFSNTEDKKHKYLVFYDRVLTTNEILKVQKCLKQSNGDDILRDENGSALTDENGIYLTT